MITISVRSDDLPAGRVVRRAGSSSRKSGACRRAAAGPAGASASSTSNTSAGSILAAAASSVKSVQITSSLRPPRSITEGALRVARERRVRVRVNQYASSYIDGRARLRRTRNDFPASAARGPVRPSRKNRSQRTKRGRGKMQHRRSRPPLYDIPETPSALPSYTVTMLSLPQPLFKHYYYPLFKTFAFKFYDNT